MVLEPVVRPVLNPVARAVQGSMNGVFSPAILFTSGEQGAWYDPSDINVNWRYNLLTYTEQFDNAAWVKSSGGTGVAPAVTANAAIAPDGTTTADSIVFNRGAGNTLADVVALSQAPAVSSRTYTQSVWLKAATPSDVGKQLALRNVAAVAVVVITLTADWVRYTRTETGSIANWEIINRGTVTADNTVTALVWGAQLQTGTTATTYQQIVTPEISYLSYQANPILYQDPAGTTPVTAVEQPVGLMKDKSGRGNHAFQTTSTSRPTLRARYNLLTFSEQFDQGVWARNNVTVTSNSTTAPDGNTTADTINAATGAAAFVNQGLTGTSGTTYTWSVWLRGVTGGETVKLFLDGGLTGGTATSPLITLTTTWTRYTLTGTASTSTALGYAYVLTGTAYGCSGQAVYVWGAQLLTAADVTATGNAYQRIADAATYDTSNPVFRPYLSFDGSDDSMLTNSVDFTSTDKMTVWAGLTKLSDAARAVLIELSGATSNPGTFSIEAPAVGAASRLDFFSTGTSGVGVAATGAAYAAPVTDVVTGIANIAAPVATIQINGAQIATTASSQGTGNYGNYPLYIGRRNNASLPFNGRAYSLIVRGAQSTAAQISSTGSWVNQRTGAF